MPWQKKSKAKAERVVRYKQADGSIKEYRYPSHTPKPVVRPKDTLDALIDAYRDSPEWKALATITKTTYEIYLRAFKSVGHVDPATIRRRDILSTRDAIAAKRGAGAANGFIHAAGPLFKWAVDREWIETSPATRITSLPAGHLPAWTQEQAETACKGLPEHLRRVVILALYTGQRRGDLCAMTWAAYDGQNIRLTQLKTKAKLVIPAHPVLKAELDAWKRDATSITILTNADGRPWRPNNLSHHMPNWLSKLGLPEHLNVHGLRKLAAANLAEAGCSTKEIGAVTGHTTLAMIELYTVSANQERLANTAIGRLIDLQKPTKIQKTEEK